jgi:hypothetical protein
MGKMRWAKQRIKRTNDRAHAQSLYDEILFPEWPSWKARRQAVIWSRNDIIPAVATEVVDGEEDDG